MKANQIAFAMALTGITSSTLSHYAEFWVIGYLVSILAALIASAIFAGIER